LTDPIEPSEAIRRVLTGVARDVYGPGYDDHALNQYRLYVEMADRISERREKANSFFLALNTAAVGVSTYLTLSRASAHALVEGSISLAGMTLCYLWYRIISSYRDLNSAKFKVVHEMEAQLPFKPYDAEWEAVGRGKNKKLYLPFTHIEILVPWIFLLLHLLGFLVSTQLV